MAARWSGYSDVFIQGREDALSRGPAKAARTARFRIIVLRIIVFWTLALREVGRRIP